MQLLLVRHGQTDFNAQHRYLGALEPELNAFGVAQASRLPWIYKDATSVATPDYFFFDSKK